MTLEDFEKLVQNRRSVRYFADKPVSRETILKLIEIAHLSPSVENTQCWQFHVILNKAMLSKLMATACYGNFVTGAGAFIVVSCNKASKPQTQETIWNPKELEFSCAGAMETLMLAAAALGLGSCWVSLHHGPAHDILQLRDHQSIVGGMMIGHIKQGEETGNDGHVRKPASEVIMLHE